MAMSNLVLPLTSDTFGDACDELLRKVDKLEATNGWLCAEVNRLTKERDELQERADYNSHGWAKANIGWAEANAEAEKWRMKCDEYREKLSHALDNAQDTLTLVDLDGEVVS